MYKVIKVKGGQEVGRLLKCYGTCEGKYPKEELVKYKSKNYCSDCLKAEIERDKDYEELSKYICQIFRSDYVNPYIKKQISDFEKGGFSLKGMRSTLWYIVNILKVNLKEEYGIAMVRYKYYEAKKYAMDKKSQKVQVKDKKEVKTEVKYVDVEKFKNNKLKKRFNLLDIKLEEEDYE